MFTDNVMHILWLGNSDTADKFVFLEAYPNDRNSPYNILERENSIEEIITELKLPGLNPTSSHKMKRIELNDC